MVLSVCNNSNWLKKLPEKIIYLRDVNKAVHPIQREYVIFSPKDSKSCGGVMKCHKSGLYLRPDYNGSVMALDFIQTSKRGEGYGKALLNFAKHLSEQMGCDGQIILKAAGLYTPMSVPHLFYRKNGFTSLDKKLDAKMDKFIKQGKRATTKDFSDMLMFYPETKKKNVTPKICERSRQSPSLFDNIFNRVFHFKVVDFEALEKRMR